MRKFVIIFALGALAGCSQPETGQASAENASAAEEAATGDSVAGRYRVMRQDGSSFVSVINADGTYAEVVNGETKVTGRWKAEGERTCYDPDGDEGRTCYSFGEPTQPAEEGSFSAKSDGGEVFTVRKIED